MNQSLRAKHPSEYRIWISMRNRTTNINNPEFKNYGGIGIRVCERWVNSFKNFIMDMGPRPTREHSIDRINNEGFYEPGNCRWATPDQQAQNRSTNIFREFSGNTFDSIETDRITIRLPRKLNEAITARANLEGRSVSNLIRRMLSSSNLLRPKGASVPELVSAISTLSATNLTLKLSEKP